MGNFLTSLFYKNREEFNLDDEEITSNPIEEIKIKNFMFSENNLHKKAILIGVNYNDDDDMSNDLYGCENDMNNLSNWIKKKCYFSDNNILKLNSKNSTKNRIINELSYMVEYANIHKNSELWLSFSGHGTYTHSKEEKDKYNEGICPSDYYETGIITDDYLNSEFINRLPNDAKLFILMDCCHSGSNMDLPYYCKENTVEKREDVTNIPKASIIKLSGCLDSQVSIDYYNVKSQKYQGAFTTSFINNFSNLDMKSLVSNINENLRKYEFSQISELALSEVSLCEYKLI
tara:strand:- start:1242 stop:2108 length:867 start_codon:yes stop_codon:yes gene_type:complete